MIPRRRRWTVPHRNPEEKAAAFCRGQDWIRLPQSRLVASRSPPQTLAEEEGRWRHPYAIGSITCSSAGDPGPAAVRRPQEIEEVAPPPRARMQEEETVSDFGFASRARKGKQLGVFWVLPKYYFRWGKRVIDGFKFQ